MCSLSIHFNEVAWLGHILLEGMSIFYAMDAAAPYSSGMMCDNLTVYTSIVALEIIWLSQLWLPNHVQANQEFNTKEFKDHSEDRAIRFESLRRVKISIMS